MPDSRGNAALYALATGNFAIGTGTFVLAGIIGPLSQDLGVSLALAGQLLTAFAVAYGVGSPFLAAITGRMRRKSVLVLGLAIFFVANLASAFAPNYATLFAVRVVASFGACLYTPTAALIALNSGEEGNRMRGLSLVITGLTMAQIAGIPLGSWLGNSFGWRWGFVMASALSAAGLVAVLATVRRDIPFHATSVKSMLKLFRDGPMMLAIAMTMVLSAGQFACYTYISPLVTTSTGVSPAGLAAFLGTWGVASFCGNLIGGRAGDRFGTRLALGGALLVNAAAMYAVGLMPLAIPVAVVVVFLWGASCFAPGPPQQARLVHAGGEAGGLALSLNASANYLGAAIGASLGGLVVANAGLGGLSWLSGTVILAAFGVMLASERLLARRAKA